MNYSANFTESKIYGKPSGLRYAPIPKLTLFGFEDLSYKTFIPRT